MGLVDRAPQPKPSSLDWRTLRSVSAAALTSVVLAGYSQPATSVAQ
jgi:hypothetical protein